MYIYVFSQFVILRLSMTKEEKIEYFNLRERIWNNNVVNVMR
jgi:hypothetical protein